MPGSTDGILELGEKRALASATNRRFGRHGDLPLPIPPSHSMLCFRWKSEPDSVTAYLPGHRRTPAADWAQYRQSSANFLG